MRSSPKWWLSGLHLVDLDGDGKLDLFLTPTAAAGPLRPQRRQGRFTLAAGNYPSTEIHLAYDADEDGKADLTMTFQDGGGKWWLNRSKPGSSTSRARKVSAAPTPPAPSHDRPRRDGKVDWLRGTARPYRR